MKRRNLLRIFLLSIFTFIFGWIIKKDNDNTIIQLGSSEEVTGNNRKSDTNEIKFLTEQFAETGADLIQRGINVMQPPYNAPANGTDDDTPAFLSACSDLASRGGGVLYIPKATFSFISNEKIEIPSNVRVICNGKLTFPNTRTKELFLIINKENIVIEGLNVDGGFTDPTQMFSDSCHCLVIKSSKNVFVSKSNFKNVKGDGLYIGRDYTLATPTHSENVVVEYCNFHNTKRNAFAMVTGKKIKFMKNVITSDNKDWNISSIIDIEPNNTSEVFEDVLIEENFVQAVSKKVICSNVGVGKEPKIFKNVKINNNHIICINKADGTVTNYAIVFSGAGTGDNISIKDNLIEGEVSNGIQANRVLNRLTIEGNEIKNAKTNGILVTYNVDNIKTNKNKVTLAAGTTGRCIHLYSNTGTNYDVSENIVDNGGSMNEAVFVNGNNYATKNVNANRNKITNGAKSLRFYQVETLRYKDNECTGNIINSGNTNMVSRDNTKNGVFLSDTTA
ncbi:hypothetical protein ACIQ4Z_10075 [Peribacillus asahii]|uniref:hypothetical protein n=1 Tax=Peribacillus asahii TaxID=228899 RepID=UPI0038265692